MTDTAAPSRTRAGTGATGPLADPRGPLAGLPALSAAARRTLVWLAVLGVAQGVALVVHADALARAITDVTRDGARGWAVPVAVSAAAVVAKALLSWATTAVSARGAAGTKAELRRALVARVTRFGGRDVPGGVGALTALATRGLDDLDVWFTKYLPALVLTATVPVIVLARILAADWVSAVVVAATVWLVPVFMILIGTYTLDRTSRAADALARLADHIVELVRGLPLLVGLGRARDQLATMRKVSEDYRSATMATLRIAFVSALALELISTLSVALVAVVIGIRLVGGSMVLDTGLLVLILAPECFTPLRRVGQAKHAGDDGLEALRRVREILAAPSPTPLAGGLPRGGSPVAAPQRTEPPAGADVRVRELTVRYRDRRLATPDRLSFDAAPGSVVALAGPSGCGKSTTLAALAGLIGDGGDVTATGRISGVDPERIAWLPQQPQTFAATVREEVALHCRGPRPVADPARAVQEALDRAAAGHLADRDPAELSVGELQRVGLARALARVAAGADLLLLDEPTAHLDADTARAVERTVADLAGRVTVVLVAHRPELLALADRLVEVHRATPAAEPGALPTPATGGSSRRGAATGLPPHDMPPAEEGEARDAVRAATPLSRAGNPVVRLVRPVAGRLLRDGLIGALGLACGIALTATSAWLIARAAERPPILMLEVAIVGVRAFGIFRSWFRYQERLRSHDTVFRLMTDLRVRMWDALTRLGPARGLSAGHTAGAGALDRLLGDLHRVEDLSLRVVLPPLSALLVGLGATAALWALLPAAGLTMLAGLLVCLTAAPALTRWADRRASAGLVESESRLMRTLAALLGAAEDLRAHRADGVVAARLDEDTRRQGEARARQSWAEGLGTGLVTLVMGLVSTAGVALAASAGGGFRPIVTGVLALTPLALVEPLADVCPAVQHYPALRRSCAAITDLFDRADRHSALARSLAGSGTAGPHPVTGLALSGLAARWPDSTADVVAGVAARVSRGQWLAVTGPSGAGKSTLLAVLLAFLRPTAGRYTQLGRPDTDTATLTDDAVRAPIAWCPQDASLFSSSLRANLRLARPRTVAMSDDEMHRALRRVGLGPLVDALPHGLDTAVGAGGTALSGGERARVAVARALLRGSEIVLLDEPTAHLDLPGARALLDDLRRALADRVVVLVTHDPAQAEGCEHRLRVG